MVDVLRDKHPQQRDPKVGVDGGAFEPYAKALRPMPIQVTLDHVERVASQLTGGAGISGTDGVELQAWLRDHGVKSAALGQVLSEWAMWMAWERMWQDDQHWLPHMLNGRKFLGKFIFEGEKLIWCELLTDDVAVNQWGDK